MQLWETNWSGIGDFHLILNLKLGFGVSYNPVTRL